MNQPLSLALERLQLMVSRPLSKEAQILRLLKRRGRFGASNRELNSICFRYGARIHDLRKDGHAIRTMRDSAGAFRFILEDEG